MKNFKSLNREQDLIDDEKSSTMLCVYPNSKISLCQFHINKNILKRQKFCSSNEV